MELVGQTERWLRYRLPPRYVRRNQQPLCIGQKQRWFLLRLTGEVQFDFARTSEPEFDQWRWAPYWEPVREVIYFKRPVYVRALTELARSPFRAASSRRFRRGGRSTPTAARAPTPRSPADGRAWVRSRPCSARHDGTPQVVRTRAPALRTVLLIAALLIGLFALYVIYELGRYDAGYDRLAVAQQRTELEVQIEHLEKANRELRTQLAELDTIRVGRAHEQAEVSRTMGDLQAQVAQQSQELAFYRGVVAQGAVSIGVKIEQLRITAGSRPGSFIVHLSLVRSGRAGPTSAARSS